MLYCTILYCTVLVPRAAMMIWSVTVPDDVELDPTQVSCDQQQTDLVTTI